MNFIKNNILSLSALAIYFFWWLYLVEFAKKVYDNHYAGATAVGLVGALTIFIILACLIGFSIAAFKTKCWKKYMVFNGIILLPLLITLLATYFL